MTIPRRSRKGLQSINTHSDRTHSRSQPHKAYMRISAIEMEKTRRMTERSAIVGRMAEIDRRVTQLNTEKDHLLRLLGSRRTKRTTPVKSERGGSKRPVIKNASALPGKAGAGLKKGGRSGPSAIPAKTGRPKGRPREPLRPLPERVGNGLRIRY